MKKLLASMFAVAVLVTSAGAFAQGIDTSISAPKVSNTAPSKHTATKGKHAKKTGKKHAGKKAAAKAAN